MHNCICSTEKTVSESSLKTVATSEASGATQAEPCKIHGGAGDLAGPAAGGRQTDTPCRELGTELI